MLSGCCIELSGIISRGLRTHCLEKSSLEAAIRKKRGKGREDRRAVSISNHDDDDAGRMGSGGDDDDDDASHRRKPLPSRLNIDVVLSAEGKREGCFLPFILLASG